MIRSGLIKYKLLRLNMSYSDPTAIWSMNSLWISDTLNNKITFCLYIKIKTVVLFYLQIQILFGKQIAQYIFIWTISLDFTLSHYQVPAISDMQSTLCSMV